MITTPAECIVDDLGKLYDNGGERWYRVTVTTPPGWPKAHRRTYTLRAWTESQAGQLGLDQFAQDVDGRPTGSILWI